MIEDLWKWFSIVVFNLHSIGGVAGDVMMVLLWLLMQTVCEISFWFRVLCKDMHWDFRQDKFDSLYICSPLMEFGSCCWSTFRVNCQCFYDLFRVQGDESYSGQGADPSLEVSSIDTFCWSRRGADCMAQNPHMWERVVRPSIHVIVFVGLHYLYLAASGKGRAWVFWSFDIWCSYEKQIAQKVISNFACWVQTTVWANPSLSPSVEPVWIPSVGCRV